MPRKKFRKNSLVERTTALCYVRQSYTRDENDMNSPDRQRANIQLVCDQHGWIPEWYEDAEGHKSGTKVKNRPAWLSLKKRLADGDVVALVANDLSRLHRKGWRIGDLLDFVDEHDVKLVLAAPGKQMDFSTPQGRIVAQLSALFDEWYAVDISQRSTDSVKHRKRRGVTVGIPPFGTVRGDDGYLQPSPDGAWLLSDGTFVAGTEGDEAPEDGALWRGYFQAAERVLQLYAQNEFGLDTIAYKVQEEGWAFRDRYNNPTLFDGDDVRRIVANWPEYGGCVTEKRARDRHPHRYKLSDYILNEERAVFPVKFLYRIGAVRRDRTIKRPANDGIKKKDFPYPLANLLHCAHCDELAEKYEDPSLRSRFGGWTSNNGKTQRYRHKNGVKCGSTNRSVLRKIVDEDFKHLLELMTVDMQDFDLMMELGIQAQKSLMDMSDEHDLEAEKQKAIALCRRRIDATIHLYADGRLSREEYERRIDINEREIAHWEARTTETQQMALELTLCVEALNRISQMWDHADDEDKQGMARNLFDEIVYDLDSQRIVDFKLKAWAERFIVLRGSLYENQAAYSSDTNNEESSEEELCKGLGSKPVGVT